MCGSTPAVRPTGALSAVLGRVCYLTPTFAASSSDPKLSLRLYKRNQSVRRFALHRLLLRMARISMPPEERTSRKLAEIKRPHSTGDTAVQSSPPRVCGIECVAG